eukprot:286580-Hanusia_phi.AAC.1
MSSCVGSNSTSGPCRLHERGSRCRSMGREAARNAADTRAGEGRRWAGEENEEQSARETEGEEEEEEEEEEDEADFVFLPCMLLVNISWGLAGVTPGLRVCGTGLAGRATGQRREERDDGENQGRSRRKMEGRLRRRRRRHLDLEAPD